VSAGRTPSEHLPNTDPQKPQVSAPETKNARMRRTRLERHAASQPQHKVDRALLVRVRVRVRVRG
jgi:hypothetical protein